jgi:hypothetical protein
MRHRDKSTKHPAVAEPTKREKLKKVLFLNGFFPGTEFAN